MTIIYQKSLSNLSLTVLPDVKAAEHGKEEPCCQWDRHSQKEGDDTVAPQSGYLKQGVTPQPHLIKAPHRGRLCNHILKRDLKTHTETQISRESVYNLIGTENLGLGDVGVEAVCMIKSWHAEWELWVMYTN